jgi:hypothetical protein
MPAQVTLLLAFAVSLRKRSLEHWVYRARIALSGEIDTPVHTRSCELGAGHPGATLLEAVLGTFLIILWSTVIFVLSLLKGS